MKSWIVIRIDGQEYFGKVTEVTEAEYKKMLDDLSKIAADVTHLSIELEDGRQLYLPREAARRAVWLIQKRADSATE